jgi:hypothetical protein
MRWLRKRAPVALAIVSIVSSALLFLPSPGASADPAPAPAAAPATTLGSGCSVSVCIEASLTAGGYGYVRARFTHSECQWARPHFHFWGPGHNFNTPDGRNCDGSWTQWFGPYNRGTYCVEGWVWEGGGWVSIGLPCTTI